MVKRISIVLDDDLYKEMERLMTELGEVNRSRFIASVIAEKIGEASKTPVASLVVIVYDHEVGDVAKHLTEVQHDFNDVIRVTTHVHLDERNCMEVIHAVGEGQRIRELTSRISRIGRGIRFLKVINVPKEAL
ncbi:CopG family ribbon-helix-helix protein [Pyrobaculum neutrophilum]|uniref:Transcriptional regulator, CopG family n=1 Tax=Pyrobaculum neutrophilum (strain DSM 2338 / JCM 9278 / NBRC 100436 / V24Sta) TaxID=444157 RepID=B1YBX5_PYRNV|nr:CopG family ribbon-helix-helix protein [Pyrobaculum neutrophilum]ACB39359.1 putative transcriptional regulator, CopG family [Pyrobaculum neutrophilum V24Sta]